VLVYGATPQVSTVMKPCRNLMVERSIAISSCVEEEVAKQSMSHHFSRVQFQSRIQIIWTKDEGQKTFSRQKTRIFGHQTFRFATKHRAFLLLGNRVNLSSRVIDRQHSNFYTLDGTMFYGIFSAQMEWRV